MSKKLSKIEIYSLADFRKADRLDRIRMHMIEPHRFVLNNDDQLYYDQLQEAWRLVSNEMQEGVAINLIQETIDGAESWFRANRMLRDIEELFAPFLDRNREMQKRKVIERMYLYAEKAHQKAISKAEDGTEQIEAGWLELAQKFLKEAAQMEGLDGDNATTLNADDVFIPEIEVTSDPSAFLEAQNAEYTEDEEYSWEEAGDDEDE